MKTRITPAYRILSMLVAITVMLSIVPIFSAAAAPASVSTSVADPQTIGNWENYFPENSNRYSGGIFIDKSVYTASEAVGSSSYFADIADKLSFGTDNFGNENFLVSLSAIGSNTEIKGYSATPSDTMLVLDLSGSMAESYTVGYTSRTGNSTVTGYNDELVASMVDATNAAIKTLQELNKHNRVGVVFYSGNSSTGSSNADTATVVLPLGRYNDVNGEYISIDNTTTTRNVWVESGRNRVQKQAAYITKVSVKTADGLKTESGQSVAASSKQAIGGTYTQNGLYKAFGQFYKGADTVIADDLIQGGTQRMPIVVLMSDGAPTTASTTYNNIKTSNAGSGTSSHATASVGFLTQLTAAWIKANLKTNYNGEDPKFYTLGVGTQSSATATGVLNPSSAVNNAAGHWDDFLGRDQRVALTLPNTDYYGDDFSTYINHLDNTELNKNYVDQYWTASDAQSMIAAFKQIVDEIIIQSRYYATLVPSNNHELDGYISFTDEIGTFMEVKNVKGIHIGEGTLVTGDMFAKSAMNGELKRADGSLTALGAELINALNSRFSISSDDAYILLDNAVSNGYIAYNDQTGDFSNYVAWYATEDNQYIAPYNASARAAHPDNAKYIVKSYLYLGDVTQNHVETSMMYTLIRVKEDIETGRQVVDANLPAALLPMITYTVEVEGKVLNESTITKMTSNKDDKAPACLLYEVGLRDDVTPYNVAEKVKDYSYLKNNDGTYNFYTNRWTSVTGVPFEIPADEDLPNNVFEHESLLHTAVALFTPSLQNERYYYTSSTPVLVKNGNSYTEYKGSKPSGDGYYHAFTFITVENGNAKLTTVYNPITPNAIDDAVARDGNTWIIPAGTPKRYFGEQVHGEDAHAHKTENKTETLGWSLYPHATYKSGQGAQGYLMFNYLGNNGRITVAPAQGIKLTKTVSEAVDGAPDSFDFEIQLSGTLSASYPYQLEKADGTIIDGTLAPVGNKLTVTIGAGDTVYIAGIAEGTHYKVTEKYNKYYVGHSANAEGDVELHTLHSVSFVNAPKGYGSLLIEKDVTHPFGESATPAALAEKKFNITVAFEGSADDLANIVAPAGITSADGNKTFAFTLSDGTDALFTNIPEGVKYTVTESNLPSGFTLVTAADDLKGEIEKDAQSKALVVNSYQPAPVSPNITLTGTKAIPDYNWTQGEFEVALQQVSIGGDSTTNIGAPIIIGTMSPSQKSYTFKMNEGAKKLTYDQVGNYSYLLYEVEPDDAAKYDANVAYDQSFGLFVVHVTDNDADGALEVSSVVMPNGNAAISGNAQNGWTITKDFTNLYMAETIRFEVQKSINGSTADHTHDSGLLFGLFASRQDAAAPLFFALTDNDGVATFAMNLLQSDYKDAPVTYYLREIAPKVEDSVVGMTYDTQFRYTVTIYWPDGDDEPTVTYKTIDGQTVQEDELVINNSYDGSVVSPRIELRGKKTLNGGRLRDGDIFVFELYETGANFSVNGRTPLQTKTVNGANNNITFNGITFDTTGTKYLVVKEVKGNAGGIGYDETQYHITLDVVKVMDPNGKIVLAIDDDTMHIHKTGFGDVEWDEIDFDNTYTINDTETVVITGKKNLPERTLVANEFVFGLYKAGESDPILTAKNRADGSFEFPALSYSQVGNHTYTVKEIVPADKYGVSYDTNDFTVTVKITDDGVGGLNKEVKINGSDTAKIEFTNHYAAAGTSITLSGIKTLEGRELKADEFTFELFKTDATFEVAANAVPFKTDKNSVFAGNKHNGDYSVTINYNDGDEGTYYYVLSEHIPTDRFGVSYDTRDYHITVLVLDDGKGNMVAAISTIDCPGAIGSFTAATLNFGNSYNAAPAEIVIEGEKSYNLTLAGDDFEFTLLNENKTELATVKNGADGKFAFPAQLLGSVGQHTFYVVEVKGDASTRITFDETEYKVVATVEDNGLGSLVVTDTEYYAGNDNASKIEFVNKYTPKPTDITLDFNVVKTMKILGTEKMGPEGFEFVLENLTVAGSQKVTTDADGKAKFTLTYTEDDIGNTYKYKLTEVKGSKANVKYSEAVYNIEVKISLGDDNKLNTAITVNTEAKTSVEAAFENEYNYTPPKQPEAPKTGDMTNIGMWLAVMFVSGTSLIVAANQMKRKKEEAE